MPKLPLNIYVDRINAAKSYPILFKIGHDFTKDYIIHREHSGYVVVSTKYPEAIEVVKLLEKKLIELTEKIVILN